LALGSNTLQLKAMNKLGKTTVIDRTVVSPPRLAEAPTTSITPTVLANSTVVNQASSSATLNEIVIEANIGPSSAWVEIVSDGKPIFSGLMLPRSKQT